MRGTDVDRAGSIARREPAASNVIVLHKSNVQVSNTGRVGRRRPGSGKTLHAKMGFAGAGSHSRKLDLSYSMQIHCVRATKFCMGGF
jgi:hypothetical protein